MMTKKIHEDREEMLQSMLQTGHTHDLNRVRPVQHCFTMLFFAPESKLVSFLVSDLHTDLSALLMLRSDC